MTAERTDLFSPAFFADPFTYYAERRKNEPVSWDERYEMWLVTAYDDVNALIRKPQLFSNDLSRDSRPPNPRVPDQDAEALAVVDRYRAEEFIQKDPPEHSAKRRPVAKRFSPREMELLRPVVRAVVDQLFDDVQRRDSVDLVTGIARPLPLRVINELMGIAAGDRGAIAVHAAKRMASVLTLDERRMATSAEGFAETAALLIRELDERRQPSCPVHDDVLGDIAGAEVAAVYTREESLANAMLIIDAGHETTVQLVCNSTLSLLRHPDQWERLKGDPDGLVASATEESLRYDPPLHAFRRIVAQDVELGGKRLRVGDRIHGVIASANRDPAYFSDPDAFDIARSPNSHLAFGAGAHYCLGQYLARMEGQEYLRALATRMPRLRLASEDIRYVHAPRVRSVTSLPVAWD